MDIVDLKDLPEAFIYAPRALTGLDLTPTENLLVIIRYNKIISLPVSPI